MREMKKVFAHVSKLKTLDIKKFPRYTRDDNNVPGGGNLRF